MGFLHLATALEQTDFFEGRRGLGCTRGFFLNNQILEIGADFIMRGFMVAFECQNVIGIRFDDFFGDVFLTTHRVAGDDAAADNGTQGDEKDVRKVMLAGAFDPWVFHFLENENDGWQWSGTGSFRFLRCGHPLIVGMQLRGTSLLSGRLNLDTFALITKRLKDLPKASIKLTKDWQRKGDHFT